MESVGDLLGRYQSAEPDEVAAVKRYIADEFNVSARITVQQHALIITVESAALANTLRLRMPVLQKIANTAKRLVLRIG